MVSESGHRLDSGSPFWRIQLDQDLLDTISAIYPEWFKVSLLLSPPPPRVYVTRVYRCSCLPRTIPTPVPRPPLRRVVPVHS